MLPQKRSLPTYPFHKKHFWITSGTTFSKAAPEVLANSENTFDALLLAGLIKRELVPADLKGGFEICDLSCRISTFDAGRSPCNYVLEDNYRPQSNVRDVDILLVPELKTYSTPTGKLSIYEEGIVYRVGVGTISINDVFVKTSGTNRLASAVDNTQSIALVNIDGSFIALLEAIRTSLKEITGSRKTRSVAQSLQSFSCKAELPEQIAIHCAKNYDSANDDTTFDVNVCGAAGNILVSIRRLSFAAAAEDVPERRNTGDKGSATMIYAKEVWDRENIDLSKNLRSAVATQDDEVSVLIFADDDDVRQIAESWNSVRSPQFITVRKGTEEYRAHDEHNIEIDAAGESSFIRLMAELDNRKSFPTKVLFLWGLKESATNGTSRIAASIYPLMLLTRELLRRPLHKFDLLFAYRYSGANVTPEYEAVAGFFRSIKLETPNANLVSLAFDDEAISWQDMLSLIAKESNTSAFEHTEVRYLQGIRHVKRVEEILPPWRKNPAPKAIANSETYLIIGGAGALGSIVAEFLARTNPNITLVLSGRSQLDEQVKRRLRAIWELGAEAFYYPSDITQPESVQHLIDQIDEAHGELKGIVHAAGVSRDKFIVESTQQDWDAVLSPKVRGVVLLDEATKDKRLDFFAVISSLSSIVGNRGQSAYAYANGFLDSFCRWRRTQQRHGRSIVLNLPWWETASGFAPDKDGQNYQMSFGYYPLKKEEGLSILNNAFSSSLDQWIAFKAVRNKLHDDLRYYWIIKEDRLEDLRRLLYRNKVVVNNDELQKLFSADVRSVVAATLKMEVSEVKENIELMDYGFDSISITSLTNELNIKLTTSLTQDTFIKYPTLAQFCEYMVKYFRENLLDYYRGKLNEGPRSRQHELLNFTYENPTRIHFGKNQVEKLCDEIPAASHVLLVYGGESIKKYGIHEEVMTQLRHCEVVEYGGIESNPRYESLIGALEIGRSKGIQFILAVGGGSVIDAAKYLSVAIPYAGADSWEIYRKQLPVTVAIPLGVVLTVSGTGSESSNVSVVSRESTKEKVPFVNNILFPKFAILDPEKTFTVSKRQTQNGIVDSFVHVLEQYLTVPAHGDVQDELAEGLLRSIVDNGTKLMSQPIDYNARANVMWAANIALNGLIGSGVPHDWTTHMIGHSLTALYGIDHAATLAMILPSLMQKRKIQKKQKLLQFGAQVWDIKTGSEQERVDKTINRTIEFFKLMDMATTLTEAGLSSQCIPAIIEQLKREAITLLGEGMDITLRDCEAILQHACTGSTDLPEPLIKIAAE